MLFLDDILMKLNYLFYLDINYVRIKNIIKFFRKFIINVIVLCFWLFFFKYVNLYWKFRFD